VLLIIVIVVLTLLTPVIGQLDNDPVIIDPAQLLMTVDGWLKAIGDPVGIYYWPIVLDQLANGYYWTVFIIDIVCIGSYW